MLVRTNLHTQPFRSACAGHFPRRSKTMKTIPSCSFALLVAVFLAGCGGAETEADPSRDAVGEAGVLHFHIDADAPLSQGANDLRISIEELSTHKPLTGASVDLSAIMPAMAHDAPEATTTEEIDGGTYI